MMASLVWALCVIGAALAVSGAVLVSRQMANVDLIASHLSRLSNKGAWGTARKLCHAMPLASVGRVFRHALGLRLAATELDDNETADYRHAPAQVPFSERVRRELLPVVDAELRRARLGMVLAAAGGVLCALSLMRPPSMGPPTYLAVGGLMAAAGGLLQRHRLACALTRAVDWAAEHVRPGDEMHGLQEVSVEPIPSPKPRPSDTIRLLVSGPVALPYEVTFHQEFIKIGRLGSVHLRLEHPDVNRIHTVIELGKSPSIIDLGTTSGTLVNGKRINKAALRVGDQIGVGPFTLTVRALGAQGSDSWDTP